MQQQAMTPQHEPAPKGGSETQRRLIRSAYRLFGEQGIDGTSLDDIARLAGVSKGIVIYHFKSKENLIHASMRWALASTAHRMEQAMSREASPRDKLLAMIDAIFTGAQVNRHFYLAYLDVAAHAARSENFRQLGALFRDIVDQFFEQVVSHQVGQGSPPRPQVQEQARVLRAIVDGLFLQWVQEPDWMRLHPWYRQTCKQAILAYLGQQLPEGTDS